MGRQKTSSESTLVDASFTVRGLDGSLVLTRGSETLEIMRDGTYQFHESDADLSIEIVSQPCYQYCEFNSALVECKNKSWNKPEGLSGFLNANGTDTEFGRYRILEGNNEPLIFWRQASASGWNTNYMMVDGLPSDDFTFSGSDAGVLSTAVNKKGNWIVLWSQAYQGVKKLYVMESINGLLTKSASLAFPFAGQNGVTSYAVDMDDNDNAIVVWREYADYDYPHSEIYKKELRNGIWTTTNLVSQFAQYDDVGLPSVSMNNRGDAIVIWSEKDASDNFQVYKSEYHDQQWTYPANLSDNLSVGGQDTANQMVEVSEDGSAIVVWTQSNGTHLMGYMAQYLDGMWTAPATLADSFTDPSFWMPSSGLVRYVSANGQGDAILLWNYYDGTDVRLYMAEFQNRKWSFPSLNMPIGLPRSDVTKAIVELNNQGYALVAWLQGSGTSRHVYKSEKINGTWKTPQDLNDTVDFANHESVYFHLDLNDRCEAGILWHQNDGHHDQVYTARLQ